MDQDRRKRVVVSRDLINSISYKVQFGVGDKAVVPGACQFRGFVGDNCLRICDLCVAWSMLVIL